jgi:hypothetical protein
VDLFAPRRIESTGAAVKAFKMGEEGGGRRQEAR